MKLLHFCILNDHKFWINFICLSSTQEFFIFTFFRERAQNALTRKIPLCMAPRPFLTVTIGLFYFYFCSSSAIVLITKQPTHQLLLLLLNLIFVIRIIYLHKKNNYKCYSVSNCCCLFNGYNAEIWKIRKNWGRYVYLISDLFFQI